MKHRDADEEIHELAALYAVGAMDGAEALEYESHLGSGCEPCISELRTFENAVACLAFIEPSTQPSPELRERLVERLRNGENGHAKPYTLSDLSRVVSIRASEGEWSAPIEGVLVKRLYVDAASGIATSLVRMMPGSSLPGHRHKGVEQIFVLEGDCGVNGERLGPGDYHLAEAGSIHQTTNTVDGTVFLLVAPEEYEFVTP